ncbi:hypothetical protein HPP92_012842 [Vanilla planifolia]|uniref:NPH3 domain-containing protein n=1 Tax=Vanilla planifolia TaxID=51239 RepID=A0A835QMA9_VANPL|nr:hypothetical protein HPP92_012842 [Vanilla planifolia]
MKELCDLKIHLNGHHVFFVSQSILCSFSGRLKKLAKHGKKRGQGKGSVIRLVEFPGGAEGFELVSRFCYRNGRIHMSPANICLLHCAAVSLEMDEEITPCNLLTQTETFLEGLFYWTLDDILTSLKTCERFFTIADSSGLLRKLISCLLAKISANSDISLATPTPSPSPSSSSSTDNSGFRCSSSIKTAEIMKPCFGREWWFEDLAVLAPSIIEKMLKELGSYGSDNKSFVLTRFLLFYLKSAAQRTRGRGWDYVGIADTSVHGVVQMGRNVFSCRGLFWVLRVVSRMGVGRECREKLEWLIGSTLEMATLDDLLVSGRDEGAYDVNLVMRLVRVFVIGEDGLSSQRMKKVGRLVDKYLREISPDQSLKVSKFLAMAESLPDSARDCYDGVYRALDIFLETHQDLPFEERTRLCRCLNYEKLTLVTCKDLAKNPRIPPVVAVQALVSQQSKLGTDTGDDLEAESPTAVAYSWAAMPEQLSPDSSNDGEPLGFNMQKMQSRLVDSWRRLSEMRGHVSKMASGKYITSSPYYGSRRLPRLC